MSSTIKFESGPENEIEDSILVVFRDQLGNKEFYCSTWPDLQWEEHLSTSTTKYKHFQNVRLIQLTAMVSGISGEADFMIFFQFAGQQKLFTNNRLEDKNPAAWQWVKIVQSGQFYFTKTLSPSQLIKDYRECHIFSSFIFPQPAVWHRISICEIFTTESKGIFISIPFNFTHSGNAKFV